MCGIIGIIYKNIIPNIIYSLQQLQNRGYDSAGIGYFGENDSFQCIKYASTREETAIEKIKTEINNISNLDNLTCGIAHTRCATHGGKTDENSHPHISHKHKFMIVHNGIIENYMELKKYILDVDPSVKFHSETDTEVISNLIEIIYIQQNEKNVLDAIKVACGMMEGTWALLIMCSDYPNDLFCTRHGSPILIGNSSDSAYVASEQSAFDSRIKDYIILNNRDICHIYMENGSLRIVTNEVYDSHKFTYDNNALSCHPYDHFMEKEIIEQSQSSLRALSLGGRLLYNDQVKLGGLESMKEELMKIDNLILLGCGTSYYAGLLGVEYLRELCNFNFVTIYDGAEFNENIFQSMELLDW